MEQSSYASGISGIPLLGETLGAHLDRIAETFAEREAVVSVHQNVRLTYRALREETDLIARGLMALGVRAGDRVGIWSPNNAEWTVAQFAVPKTGAILVNVNPAYRSSEASYALRQSGVSVLFMQARYKTSDYVGLVAEIRSDLPDLRMVVLLGDDELATPLAGAMRYDDVRTAARNVDAAALAQRHGAVVRRGDEHPVYVGHDGLPQRRDAVAPQRAQQRLLHR